MLSTNKLTNLHFITKYQFGGTNSNVIGNLPKNVAEDLIVFLNQINKIEDNRWDSEESLIPYVTTPIIEYINQFMPHMGNDFFDLTAPIEQEHVTILIDWLDDVALIIDIDTITKDEIFSKISDIELKN